MSEDWRDKYLQALEEQEQTEERFGKQQELLRQAVVRLSLAAEGQDVELDEQLTTLRASLRKGYDRPGEVRLIQLDDQLRAFESRRGSFSESVEINLKQLTEQLQQLPLDRGQLKPLRQFQRHLASQSKQVSAFPKVLKQLCDLQQQCLQALKEAEQERKDADAQGDSADDGEKGGLLRQIFGGKKKTESRDSHELSSEPGSGPESEPSGDELVETAVVEDETGESTAQQQPSEDAARPDAEVEPEIARDDVQQMSAVSGVGDESQAESDTEEAIEGHYQSSSDIDDDVHEPAFSHISDRITRILGDLLDSVDPEECVLEKVEMTRRRIDRGLNWFELVPALEDIRDLVMQAYLAADSEFSAYLSSVNSELHEIYALLGADIKRQVALNVASDDMQSQVNGQLLMAEQSLQSASGLDQLKDELQGQIGAIRNSLEGFSEARASSDATEQTQQLMDKVRELEADAVKHSAELEEVRQQALIDSLTQLPNREAWAERSYHEYQRWQRYQRPLVLAVIDIDLFKQVNDNYGHQAGDRVLKVIAKAIHRRLRDVDFFARYGGEEFGLLLPETELQDAMKLLNAIREAIAAASFHFKEKPIKITVSMGVAEFKAGDNVETAFAKADKALYKAKDQGRNCCVEAE